MTPMINAPKSAMTDITAPDEVDTLLTDEVRSTRREALVCRNITVNGRRTSMRIESVLWDALSAVCNLENLTVDQLCSRIEKIKGTDINLTAATRAFLVAYFRHLATEEGHARAGHGRLKAGNGIDVDPAMMAAPDRIAEMVH
jgi:predicted DNA-binding ribbon-helix-helix protein